MTVEPPTGFKRPTFSDARRIELEPGDELVGEVVTIKRGESEFGGWALMIIDSDEHGGPVAYFPQGECKQAVTMGEVDEGDLIWVGKEEETDTFTDDEGDEHRFHPTLFAKGDDLES